jgi:hypothetical protein
MALLPKLDSGFWREAVREIGGRTGLSRRQQVGIWLALSEQAKRGEPFDFDAVGFNEYSETHEDGILLAVFAAIGMTDRRCVDIGAGRIDGSNVANLIVNHGFTGLLVDGNPKLVAETDAYYRGHPATRIAPPETACARMDPDNIDQFLASRGMTGTIDLFCLDIDGIDYWILKALSVVEPRVLVVEYQDILGPERSWTVPYQRDFEASKHPANRSRNNYSGASLRAFTRLAESRGYKLVGVNRGGWNAFFVKQGLSDDALPNVTIESCFRYPWNQKGIAERFPLVRDLEWVEV